MQQFFFAIRGRDWVVEDDPIGTYLPNIEAALSYAEYTVRELRKKSCRNDSELMMVVQEQERHTLLYVPFFPGS